jgi:hypothetical protein
VVRKNWQYKLRNFIDLSVGVFDKLFEDMPYDPYVKGNFRKRRYSSLKLNDENEIEILPHKTFLQKSDVNKLLGDVEREYEELDEQLVKHKDFFNLLVGFIESTGINPHTTEIGVHQMRIHSSIYIKGSPAPEGRHKDGFDFVGIYCANRHLVSGGISKLYINEKTSKSLLSKMLKPNEMLVVNDKEVFHDATELQPTTVDLGYRDVFVFTA